MDLPSHSTAWATSQIAGLVQSGTYSRTAEPGFCARFMAGFGYTQPIWQSQFSKGSYMRKEHMLLVVIAVQAALIAGMMFGEARHSAMAQIPDQGAQLQQLVEQTKDINAKMDRAEHAKLIEQAAAKNVLVAEDLNDDKMVELCAMHFAEPFVEVAVGIGPRRPPSPRSTPHPAPAPLSSAAVARRTASANDHPPPET